MLSEALAGMPSFIAQQREQAKYLRFGGWSGHSGQPGQPMLIDERTGQILTKVDTAMASASEVATAARADASAGAAKTTSGEPKAGTEEKAPAISPMEKGELIKRDVEPAIVFNTKGEKLGQIARDHLGPEASAEEVQKHMAEIARINGIKDPDRPLPGGRLTLPGHSQDGGFVTADADGNKRTIWQNGLVRGDYRDNSGYERGPDGDGNYFVHHWGSDPQDHSYLIKKADGSYLVADGRDDRQGHVAQSEQERLLIERAHLIDAADEKIADPKERAQFRKDMQQFEERMAKRLEEANGLRDQLVADGKLSLDEAVQRQERDALKARQELTDTFKETSRLLEAKDNPTLPVKERDRVVIAEQVLHQAAHPTSVDQGNHSTCNVATLEARGYTMEPSKVAKLVADVATEGKCRVPGPPEKTVELDPKSLSADKEARNNPAADGQRSYASQIFQITAVNIYFSTHGYDYTDASGIKHHADPGQTKFEQRDPVAGQKPEDSGERLMDYSRRPPQEVRSPDAKAHFPGLTDDQIREVNKQISGGDGQDVVLSYGYKSGNSNWCIREQDLDAEISRLKSEGKLPVIVSVHSDNYPFHADAGEEAGGRGDWHVVTVTGYEAGPPSTLTIDNQWGSQSDHLGKKGLTTHELFLSMQDPKSFLHISELETDVASNRNRGTVDFLKETELLRLKRGAKMLDDKKLRAEVEQRYEEFLKKVQQQRHDGGRDREQEKKIFAEFRDLRAILPAAERAKLNAHLKSFVKENHIDLN